MTERTEELLLDLQEAQQKIHRIEEKLLEIGTIIIDAIDYLKKELIK